MDNQLLFGLAILSGFGVGGAFVWMIFRSKARHFKETARSETAAEFATLQERLASKDNELQGLRAALEKETAERGRLLAELRVESDQRSAAEQRASRINSLESEIAGLQEYNANLRSHTSALESQLDSQEKTAAEKLDLVIHAREELTLQFKSLANDILDEKSRKFTDQNKNNLETLLTPLGEKIRDFEKKVEEVYDKESKQRFSLENEIKTLRDLNTRISQDAINLTNALKGQSKTQGAWGEIILERVLEMSGLVKGREYEIQVTLTSEEGKRSCPDVIVYLPEKRHLVIDSKVNLLAYERYCSLADGPERDAELKRNIAAFRKHIGELDLKRYQDHYKLNSLDFVLMFVPVEGAFMVAVQADASLFNQAFEKNLVIVSPSTLLATMRTISNLWRQEYQSRNAVTIAKQAGRLYDKFAGFVSDLKDIGVKLQAAQTSYDAAHNKLATGRGNIVSRVENLRLLGARTKKGLPAELLEDAMDENDTESINRETLVPTDEFRPLSLDEGGLFRGMIAVETEDDGDSMPLLNAKGVGGSET
ncbi:MAG: DNA recombination protein RmuC [Acidobacteriota bacterium]